MAEALVDVNVSPDNEALDNQPQQHQGTGGQGTFAEATLSERNTENNVESPSIDEDIYQGGGITAEDECDGEQSENGSAVRPKRSAKPSLKSLENRMQNDSIKLEKLWDRVVAVITKYRDHTETVEAIRVAMKDVRATFHEYETVWLSYMDFLARANTTETNQERESVNNMMASRKQFLQSAISDLEERKREVLMEIGSIRSGSRASTVSSSAVRAQARAEAAAAIKRAEMQKHRSLAESQSILRIQQEEMALARRRNEEQAHIESLRLEEEAAVAIAKANAIDDELGIGTKHDDLQAFELPEVSSSQKVADFISEQHPEPTQPGSNPAPMFPAPQQRSTTHEPVVRDPTEMTPTIHQSRTRQAAPSTTLNPSAPEFHGSDRRLPPSSDADGMRSYVDFMARRELIANKIEKFDDNPMNYHTWKASFNNMIKNVTISPSEELSLLIEYTTRTSKQLVQRLRNAYIANPDKGTAELWRKLDERYGSNAVLVKAHLDRLSSFTKINYGDNKKIQELADLLLELDCAKKDGVLSGLRVLDEPIYLKPIVTKLPRDVQGRWQKHAFRYMKTHDVHYPCFGEFVNFIEEISREKNDPNLSLTTMEGEQIEVRSRAKPRRAYKTDIPDVNRLSRGAPPSDPTNWCLLHRKPHSLTQCRAFRAKPIAERKSLLKQHGVCYRCLASTQHMAKDCRSAVKCSECNSERHLSALHVGLSPERGEKVREDATQLAPAEEALNHGEEAIDVISKCTAVCRQFPGGKSCSKICLANIYTTEQPESKVRAYVVIDDQSNCSLAKSTLFDKLNLQGETIAYSLQTCAGQSEVEGRVAKGVVIESLDGSKSHLLTNLVECNAIPDNKDEIATPEVALSHPHLRPIVDNIPALEDDVEILVLVGRDAPQFHKVHESKNGRGNSPWAQRLDLGWVIIGEACIDGAHQPSNVSAYRTQLLPNGRPSLFEPCPNAINARLAPVGYRKETFVEGRFEDGLAKTVFAVTKDDDKPGLSIEDRQFLGLMEETMVKNAAGNWTTPLPFKHQVEKLPESRPAAAKRLKSTCRLLERKPEMKQHYLTFMQGVLDKNLAEPVPVDDLKDDKPHWYLPHFGVYHPQKPGKVRVVFDAAAETSGVSLNKLLLSGPDLTNSLLGVLLRFRQNPVAVTADVEQMFYSFFVNEEHRDFLRFLWFRNNDPSDDVIDYRMKVHLFGNTSSPAVATFGLKKTAVEGQYEYGQDAKEFVDKNFYVDDGLTSTEDTQQAIDLMQRTQAMLATANLRLHKIASNEAQVSEAFSTDRSTNLQNLDMSKDTIPVQRSLGVCWDLNSDCFTFRVDLETRPFTKRGVLSVTNSLYDPLGLATPVTIRGKFLLRAMSSHLKERQLEQWDEPFPEEEKPAWNKWLGSLATLQQVQVPRAYSTSSLEKAQRVELHVFCDASTQAIAAVAYLKVIQLDGTVHISFVMGKAKLAPAHATTIPRLELCSAVLAVELADLIQEEQVVKLDLVSYYSDSKVVLGYIANQTRRFYIYVGNRVQRIRKSSQPDQWCHVPTDLNPADLGTRSVDANALQDSLWINGPTFLRSSATSEAIQGSHDAHVCAADDPEVRKEVVAKKTGVHTISRLGADRFSRFSKWSSLVKGLSRVIAAIRSRRSRSADSDTPATTDPGEIRTQAEMLVIANIQEEAFGDTIECIKRRKQLPAYSPLLKLNPQLDSEGLLRVGGRLEHATGTNDERHPLILPASHHATSLLVEHAHIEVKHQGRHFTQGKLRSKGYWIVGGKRLVGKIIRQCLRCRRLRGKFQVQLMADLPPERVTPAPPFTNVGMDVFGPWSVVTRRTRGGAAQSKRWAVIFTCLAIRAVHIEVIESLDTSSFINALRRFMAIRGPVKQLRCDCGTNFVGARNELEAALAEMSQEDMTTYLDSNGCQWVFNPPHASHAGGVWERMIGIARNILNSMFADLRTRHLTHDVLSTLMAEIAAIINNRPLVPVSNDPSAPEILTPASILSMKTTPALAPPGKFTQKDMYTSQWRQVQHLANTFWARWKREFLPLLQPRRKWRNELPDVKEGDLVLMRDQQVPRNLWPLARVTKAIASKDKKVRKAQVEVAKEDCKKRYLRPVTELIVLRTVEELSPTE